MNPGTKSAALITGAVVLLIGAFFVGRATAPETPVERTDSGPEVRTAGPTRVSNGVPVGYARSEQGAIQAALNFTRVLTPGPDESRDIYSQKLRTIAADEWESELQSTIESWSTVEGDLAVLRYKTHQVSQDEALIEVWFAGFADPRDGAPGSLWGRSQLSLVWERGDWKVAQEDSDEGPWPTPLGGPSSSSELEEALEGFVSFDYEPQSAS